jgi:outer membrane protein insertion porin family
MTALDKIFHHIRNILFLFLSILTVFSFSCAQEESVEDQIERALIDDEYDLVSHNKDKTNIDQEIEDNQDADLADDNDDDDDNDIEEEGDDDSDSEEDDQEEIIAPKVQHKRIKNIIVEGYRQVPLEALISRIPYQEGEIFNKLKTSKLIHNVHSLGYFRQVEVYIEDVDDEYINLVVVVEEKRPIESVKFVGNKHLSEAEIKKKIDFSKIPAIDEDDIPRYIKILKKLYRDKDFHNVEIAADLQGDTEKVAVVFTIKEGRRTLIKRVLFTGNNHFRAKKLRSLIFTREDWAFGFLDRSGSYQPEAIEADKQVIENFYQSNGFLNAKVIDASVDIDEMHSCATVTFHVREGDRYCISDIRIPGNEVVPEELLLARIPIKPGELFSKERVRETIELLRLIWGEYGYINADIEPSIQPNDDDKTVSLAFYSELGPQIYLNRVNIIGNVKTHDKVIRRQLTVQEGCLLTTKAMEESKNRVEGLGYFDTRNGVNWRIIPISKDKVDLELIVKEVKTGRFEMQMGIGGTRDISSPTESFNVGVNVSDTNLFGRGIHLNVSTSLSKEERNLILNITQPWLFDRPIHASGDLYFKRSIYDEFKLIQQPEINENITGGSFALGTLSRKLWDATISGKVGVDGISYKETPIVNPMGLTPAEVRELQTIFDKRFTSGAFLWFGGYAFKDIRNHPLHPSRGYQWALFTKIAVHSTLKDNPRDVPGQVPQEDRIRFGYAKLDLDASWYTPLIGERDLVLGLHGHLGVVGGLGKKSIPFRELYHIGGPASVRGFLYGEIGPMWMSPSLQRSDMIGAKKAFWLNAEMVFPITSDFSMKGAVFYDGGAGWDTPDSNMINPARLRNNSFSFRHSVGFGVRMLRPTPVKIDWGFKLDRKPGESASEVHFSMYHEF